MQLTLWICSKDTELNLGSTCLKYSASSSWGNVKEFIVLSERLGHCSPQSPVGPCIIMVERRRLTKTRHVIQIKADFFFFFLCIPFSQPDWCMSSYTDKCDGKSLGKTEISVRAHTKTKLKGSNIMTNTILLDLRDKTIWFIMKISQNRPFIETKQQKYVFI